MNKDIIQGNWQEIKGKLKQQWAKFTDDDILKMSGSYDELAGHLQKKYGYEKDKANAEIQNFIDQNNWQQK